MNKIDNELTKAIKTFINEVIAIADDWGADRNKTIEKVAFILMATSKMAATFEHYKEV